MMARKLSVIAQFIAFIAIAVSTLFNLSVLRAEGELEVSKPSGVVGNPFATSELKPRIVAEEPQDSPHSPTTYQNPFANASKAPPIDPSLRNGPVSRWQFPAIPPNRASAVRAAVLNEPSLPVLKSIPVTHTAWDQLPPSENLRSCAAAGAANLSYLTDPDPIIRTTPPPIAQPDSIVSNAVDSSAARYQPPAPPTGSAISFALNPPAANDPIPTVPSSAETKLGADIPCNEKQSAAQDSDDDLSSIIHDTDESAEDWLGHAQDASASAETAEELTTVIEMCDRGIHGTPSAEVLSSLRRLSAWAHNRRGECLADAQHSEEAIQDFQAAISMDPSCSLAIHNRGVSFAQRNQFAAALRDFNRVIELNPGLAIAYRNRAELLSALGRMEEAVTDYDQAIASLPEDASLLRARAHAQQRLGNFTRATADINRAIQILPHDPELLTQRGSLAAEQGKFDRAQDDFRQAIKIAPNFGDAYRSLAWLQATCPDPKFRDPKQALSSAKKAATLSSPDDYLVLDTQAAASAGTGQFDQAVELQQKALVAAPAAAATPLQQRLALYHRQQVFTSAPVKNDVRAVSHETPVNEKAASRAAPQPHEIVR